jgi:hypothetical protein
MEQLLLFEDTKEEQLKREIKDLKEKYEKSRKAQFAKLGELNKLYNDLNYEFDIFRKLICNNIKI